MKKFNYTTMRLRLKDAQIISFRDNADAIITSKEFIEKFRVYIEDIARFKTINGRKIFRSTSYAAIGILDTNDLMQEAYLAFLEAYQIVDWDKIDASGNSPAELWSYLKKSTILNLDRQLRFKKDGIRIPEREHFKTKSNNMNILTTLFGQLEKVFFNNQEDVALSKWETDLTGMFLEVKMDEYLDLTRGGKRNLQGIERVVLKELYGIDGVKSTYQEISDRYQISQSTLRSLKERAVKKLQSEESKKDIANFLHEYRIKTQANYEK